MHTRVRRGPRAREAGGTERAVGRPVNPTISACRWSESAPSVTSGGYVGVGRAMSNLGAVVSYAENVSSDLGAVVVEFGRDVAQLDRAAARIGRVVSDLDAGSSKSNEPSRNSTEPPRRWLRVPPSCLYC